MPRVGRLGSDAANDDCGGHHPAEENAPVHREGTNGRRGGLAPAGGVARQAGTVEASGHCSKAVQKGVRPEYEEVLLLQLPDKGCALDEAPLPRVGGPEAHAATVPGGRD